MGGGARFGPSLWWKRKVHRTALPGIARRASHSRDLEITVPAREILLHTESKGSGKPVSLTEVSYRHF